MHRVYFYDELNELFLFKFQMRLFTEKKLALLIRSLLLLICLSVTILTFMFT